MDKYKRLAIFLLCIAITNRFYIDLYFRGFTIALSVITIPLLLYKYIADFNPLLPVSIAGIITPSLRGFLEYNSQKDFHEVVAVAAPDVIFGFSYAMVYYLMYYRRKKKELYWFGITIFCCDVFSNIVEIFIYARGKGISISIIKGLLLIAAIRACIVLTIIIIFRYYKTTLAREEREARYRQLFLKTSSFKSEIYFMNKNIAEVEDVMKKSFQVYKQLSESNQSDEVKNMALDIAKDVHEIKKDYLRVIKGLKEFSQDELDIESMRISEIAEILEADAREFIRKEGYDIKISFHMESDATVKQHFYLTSILKNLINNSIEAIGKEKGGTVSVHISRKEDRLIFAVLDNGEGISPEDMPFIYLPGFSSRFDDNTGEISRGLGLTLVKDLVENRFGGTIHVETEKNKGTTFSITLPAQVLEGTGHEVLYR
ncbi:hypothetical protein DCMF_10100 [Candidatus Formimonas warabiya]|uniref:histidine kinase n=2 Tax=Formimonas warabiya TaxID=1761012 RepID=A0A3G1L1J1_FORW1|nr:hypothetical protein DCMF_10100 [Candidatus Formimonas warabiya]